MHLQLLFQEVMYLLQLEVVEQEAVELRETLEETQHLIQLTLKEAEVVEDLEVTTQAYQEVLEEEPGMPWAVAEEGQELNLQMEIIQDMEIVVDQEESLQEAAEEPAAEAEQEEDLEKHMI
jgi:hypothetical protein